MAITPDKWIALKVNIINKMNAPSSSPDYHINISNYIAQQYFSIISNAETIMTKNKLINNPVLVAAGKASLANAFITFYESNKTIAIANPAVALPMVKANYATLIANINLSLQTFWMGSIMGSVYQGMPPGHVAFVPICKVLVVPPYMANLSSIPLHNPAATKFVNEIVNGFINQLPLISGIHTLIVLPSPAPPYPLPWVGIK